MCTTHVRMHTTHISLPCCSFFHRLFSVFHTKFLPCLLLECESKIQEPLCCLFPPQTSLLYSQCLEQCLAVRHLINTYWISKCMVTIPSHPIYTITSPTLPHLLYRSFPTIWSDLVYLFVSLIITAFFFLQVKRKLQERRGLNYLADILEPTAVFGRL